MQWDQLAPEASKRAQEILGYLNFSSGASDPRFLRNMNELCAAIGPACSPESLVRTLAGLLRSGLAWLRGHSEAFRDAQQAEAVVGLVFDVVLPGYRGFHRDLLAHQSDAALWQPFFLGRVCEAVLRAGPPWEPSSRILEAALMRLNDFIGHRPVAVLRTAQKIQPYAHEWVRPIPLYIREAGVAVGRYHEVVSRALEVLETTDGDLLDAAWFDPRRLDEFALDPRAYDFDHPVNRRPNYHFGGWDPHAIDNAGFYRRFVFQQVTLDGLIERVERSGELAREELLLEAAAVLAGTILMGSGVSGSGPEAHDSSTTLSTLIPRIAAYRDAFYERLIARVGGAHGDRLRAEARNLRQPFAGARQHLNQTLSRRRAEQLQHVHLARLYARMGFTEAAMTQVRIVPVTSARMRSEIDCRLTTAHAAIDERDLPRAATLLAEIEDLLFRAVECGAMVDPWNILGFGGQFSRFPAPEDSVHDERIDDLLELMNELFAVYARLLGEAAAAGDEPLRGKLSGGLDELARWWDRFASTEVSEIEGISGLQARQSAEQVADALAAWQSAGSAAGNIAFWRRHAEHFRSPKAYALLVDALLKKDDLLAAMALMTHWLSQYAEIPLAQNEHSFHLLAMEWMERLWGKLSAAGPSAALGADAVAQRWDRARRFLDFLEANAEDLWRAPRLEPGGSLLAHDRDLLDELAEEESGEEELSEEELSEEELSEEELSEEELSEEELDEEDSGEEEAESLYGAAYEGVIYRDTTDDGFEGEMLESGVPASDFELTQEAEAISRHLAFLITSCRLWRAAAVRSLGPGPNEAERDEVLAGWLRQLRQRVRDLGELLAAVHRYRIPAPRGNYESLLEFDRRQAIKESLLDRVIAASVEAADTERVIRACTTHPQPCAALASWEAPADQVLRALVRGDAAAVRHAWPELAARLAEQPLLYLPLYRGGHPQKIVASRGLQHVLRRLLVGMPRLGLLEETYRLLETAQTMEREHAAGPGAVTEFDHLFELACKGIVQCLVASSSQWNAVRRATGSSGHRTQRVLIDIVQRSVEVLLRRWLAHNRGVRLSVLEHLGEEERWLQLRRFIERDGADLFSQKFMTYGNLRAILHEGAENYLRTLREDPEQSSLVIVEDLESGRISPVEAAHWLEITLEAIVENYAEYRDYNTTTTQSDRGALLYILLDFLRLKASYERVAWNLRPVVLAHQVLLQYHEEEAAATWRRAIAERSRMVADEHLDRYEKLCTQYGIRLRSIATRLEERFVRPLAIDQLCAWIRPAMEELRAGRPTTSFDLFQREVAEFTREPEGVGLDVPVWLETLEDEVRRIRAGVPEGEEAALAALPLPQVRLSLAELRRQMEAWETSEGA